tara:strand:- start:691 stop:993 length:303 start_codon:yes stop_codon:yes gene_type:complete
MELDKELLKEFQKLGIEYPLITKMFMDLVSVVAQQSDQITGLAETLESLALDAQSKEVIIKEHEWKLNILKENLMDSFKEGNDLPSTPFSSLGKKKTLLN